MRQLREAIALRPADSEARTLLESWTSAGHASAANLPLERVKRNFDEASFRQLAFEIESAAERKLAQADPAPHARAHVEMGRQMLAEGFKAEAERLFREAILLDPANPAAHGGLAESLEAADAAAARAEAMTSLHLQPSAATYLVLARLDLRDNKPQAAIEDADHALALEPGNSAALALKHEIASKPPGGPAPEPHP
jgi:tetratricopeptide (TPR) repeat protein